MAEAIEHHPNEYRAPAELQSSPRRVVILGSRTSGAADLAGSLQRYIEERGLTGAVVDFARDVSRIADAFYGRYPGQPEVTPDNPPIAVVAYPEMRQSCEGMSSSVPTPMDMVRQLCEEHGMPLVYGRAGEVRQVEALDSVIPQLGRAPES